MVAEHPHNLFTLLGGRYAMNVHESVTRLCPEHLCAPTRRALGVHPGLRGMLRDVASIWGDFADPAHADTPVFGGLGAEDTQAMTTADRFLATLRPGGSRPRLDFLHVLLPHFPWHYLPTGQDYVALPGHTTGLHGQDWPSDEIGALMRVRHLLQVQAADTFVGGVVARLRALGVYDDTLLVVTADHGVAFRGGAPIRGVTRATIPDIAWTPLLIKAPNQHAGGHRRPSRGVDRRAPDDRRPPRDPAAVAGRRPIAHGAAPDRADLPDVRLVPQPAASAGFVPPLRSRDGVQEGARPSGGAAQLRAGPAGVLGRSVRVADRCTRGGLGRSGRLGGDGRARRSAPVPARQPVIPEDALRRDPWLDDDRPGRSPARDRGQWCRRGAERLLPRTRIRSRRVLVDAGAAVLPQRAEPRAGVRDQRPPASPGLARVEDVTPKP